MFTLRQRPTWPRTRRPCRRSPPRDADLPAQTVDLLDQRRHRCGLVHDRRRDRQPVLPRRAGLRSTGDFDGDNVYEVEVTADDNGGNATPQLISVTVDPVNDNSPVFTTPAAANVAENTTVVKTVNATDADLPAQTVDLLDQRRSGCGLVHDRRRAATCPSSPRPTSKSPADFDGDNVYEVEVTADDNARQRPRRS